MSWTSPPTFVSGTVLTAGNVNILSNDLSFLAGSTGNGNLTTDTTTNTSYGNLVSTPNSPSVTVTTGGSAIVILTALLGTNTTGDAAYMSYNITGATAGSPNDSFALACLSAIGNAYVQASWMGVRSGLTPGSNIFTALYRVTGGMGTFENRYITVIPLP